jgi:hypothetical protein
MTTRYVRRAAPREATSARNSNCPATAEEPAPTRRRLTGRFAEQFGGNGPRSTVTLPLPFDSHRPDAVEFPQEDLTVINNEAPVRAADHSGDNSDFDPEKENVETSPHEG